MFAFSLLASGSPVLDQEGHFGAGCLEYEVLRHRTLGFMEAARV